MTKRRGAKTSRRKTRKARVPRAGLPATEAGQAALPEELPGRDPSLEELVELEASAGLEEARERAMGLARAYPRANQPLVKPLTEVLRQIPGLKPVQARVVAQSLKQVADNACDLGEIVDRILGNTHNAGEVAELVLAFQLVTEQLGTYADVLEDKLYDVFDRAKGLK